MYPPFDHWLSQFFSWIPIDADGDNYIGSSDIENTTKLLTQNELNIDEINAITEKVRIFFKRYFFEKVRLCVLDICRFCWKLISTMTRSYLWMNFKLWWPRVQISCRLFTSQYKSQLPICYAWKLYPPKNLEESLLSPWSDHFWFGMIMIQPYLRGCHAMSEE